MGCNGCSSGQGRAGYHDQLMELMMGKPNGEGAAHHEGLNYGMKPKTDYKAASDGTYNSPDMGRIPYSPEGSRRGGSGARNLYI